MDSEQISGFHEFLKRYYHPDIVELSAAFPEKRTLLIDWSDIEAYNDTWTDNLRQNANKVLEGLEQALATYPLIPPHGQLSFEGETTSRGVAPFIRLQGVPDSTNLSDLPKYIGGMTSVEGWAKSVSPPQAQAIVAQFECEICGNVRRSHQIGDIIEEPEYCQTCGSSETYVVDGLESVFSDTQTATIVPQGHHSEPEIAIEFRGSLIGSINESERVKVSGIVYGTDYSERFPDITILAHSIRESEYSLTHPLTERADTYLDVDEKTKEQFQKSLEEFVDRSVQILSQQQLTEEDAQAKIITPLLHALGWNVYSHQVSLEYAEPNGHQKVDYMLSDRDGRPRIPVEAKSPARNLADCTDQLHRYLVAFDCKVGILTTGEEIQVYKVQPDSDKELEIIFDLHISELANNSSLLYTLHEDVVSKMDPARSIFEAI